MSDLLRRAVEEMVPNENVSSDFSSYANMVNKWRGSLPPPSEVEVNNKISEIQAADAAIKYIKDREVEYDKQGFTLKAKVDALWAKLMEAKAEDADALQVTKASIDSVIVKP